LLQRELNILVSDGRTLKSGIKTRSDFLHFLVHGLLQHPDAGEASKASDEPDRGKKQDGGSYSSTEQPHISSFAGGATRVGWTQRQLRTLTPALPVYEL
jgi:hypothetical protein